MRNHRIRVSIFLNYVVFAILLNSAGAVILQAQRYYGVLESSAALLEVFKDLSILLASFTVTLFITRLGYKKSMLLALAALALVCFVVPLLKSFVALKLLFAVTGVCFAITKISVFGTIGILSRNEKQHASTMNFIESCFMLGILAGYFLFSYYVEDTNPNSPKWLSAYNICGLLAMIAFGLLLISPLNETGIRESAETSRVDWSSRLKLLLLPAISWFAMSAFFYVLCEQSMMSWLPTYNNKVLSLSSSLSIQLSGLLIAAMALGRFTAGLLLKKIYWLKYLLFSLLLFCVVMFAGLGLNSMGAMDIKLFEMPAVVFVVPLAGFFLAPIYPVINSVLLSGLPVKQHGKVTGLIILFSALGCSLGSWLTGMMFEVYGGNYAFYLVLLPAGLLSLTIYQLSKASKRGDAVAEVSPVMA